MFKQLITIAALSATLSAHAQDSMTSPDKIKHFGVSVAMSSIGTLAFESRTKGFAGCVVVGIGKEVWDSRHPGHTASARDLIADAAGCAAGAYLGGLLIVPESKGVTVGYVTQF